MTDLQRLKAELEAQTDAFAECFAQLSQLDPELEIALSPEWMAEFSGASCIITPPAAPWGIRA